MPDKVANRQDGRFDLTYGTEQYIIVQHNLKLAPSELMQAEWYIPFCVYMHDDK